MPEPGGLSCVQDCRTWIKPQLMKTGFRRHFKTEGLIIITLLNVKILITVRGLFVFYSYCFVSDSNNG